MRSSSRLPPLNSSATALSSSSSLSSSFSLSSLSSSYTPSASLPSHSSLLFVFLTVFLLLLFNVAASPISPSQNRQDQERVIEIDIDDSKIRSSNGSQIGMQMDEPPRNIDAGDPFPSEWTDKPQRRPKRLINGNSQYLQIHEGKISGTYHRKPVFGILLFSSHNMNLVIETLHTEEFLCMNRESRLYVSKNLTEECYIDEQSLYNNGSQMYIYKFVNHSTPERPLYLGINCHPLLGNKTSSHKKSSRFMYDTAIPRSEVQKIRRKLKEGGTINEDENKSDAVKPMCERKTSKRAERRRAMKRLRKKWCLNSARGMHNLQGLYEKCKNRFKRECGNRGGSRKRKKECVCELLRDFQVDPKRARKKCLMDLIVRWVIKRKEKPNREFIRHLANRLLPGYSNIMRRRQKNRQRKSGRDKDKRVPTVHSHVGKRGRRPRMRPVKLTLLFNRYYSQLIIQEGNRTATSSMADKSASISSSSSSHLSSSSSSSSATSSFYDKSISNPPYPTPRRPSSRKKSPGSPRHRRRHHHGRRRSKARPR